MGVRFEYAPGATPIDLGEAAGLIPAHLTLQRELNEYEEANILEGSDWLFARRRGDPLEERFIHLAHRRMFNQTWRWAGRPRRSNKNIGVPWVEVPAGRTSVPASPNTDILPGVYKRGRGYRRGYLRR